MAWIHTYHALYFAEDYVHGLDAWQREVNAVLLGKARSADVRISVSRWLQELLQRRYGIESEYVPNAVDIDECSRASAGRFRQRYGFRGFVLFGGGLEPIKNPALFFDVVKSAADMRFVMCGSGVFDGVRDCIPGLSNLSVLGALSHSDLLDAVAAARCVLVTSRREGLPTLVLEAMALGRPVVVPRDRGCLELTRGLAMAFTYEGQDVEMIVRQLQAALAASRGREESVRRATQEYSWNVVIRRLDTIYDRVARTTRRSTE